MSINFYFLGLETLLNIVSKFIDYIAAIFIISFLLFLVGCIGTRSVLAYAIQPNLLSYLGYITLIPAIGFTYIYLTNSRQTGPEVLGDKIWWNNIRPIHALLYLTFSISAIFNLSTNAWVF